MWPCICLFVCPRACMWLCVRARVCVCARARLCVRARLCARVCVHACVRACVRDINKKNTTSTTATHLMRQFHNHKFITKISWPELELFQKPSVHRGKLHPRSRPHRSCCEFPVSCSNPPGGRSGCDTLPGVSSASLHCRQSGEWEVHQWPGNKSRD